MKPQVDIVVERQWHAPALAHALMANDLLGKLYTGFPKRRYTSLGLPAIHVKSHPLPALWNYGLSKFNMPNALRWNEPSSLARFVSKNQSLSSVVTCLATSYQHLFPELLGRPIVRVIECGSMHPEDHFLFQQRARREACLSHTCELPSAVVEESETSKLAHFLICGSQMVVDSYLKRGYLPDRVLHCPYGVDTGRFRFEQRNVAKERPLRIATVGVIGIRKGIVRLLKIGEWAETVGIRLELHLIGPIEPEVESLISNSSAICIRRGILKGEALVEALHGADAYCLPSYEEGFPISQLEAMATGLPAIISNDTGGREAVTDGVDGIILTEFTNEEFNSKLRLWLMNPNRLPAAGAAASERVRSHYSMAAYSDNVATCYRQVLELSNKLVKRESVENAFPSVNFGQRTSEKEFRILSPAPGSNKTHTHTT